MLLKLALLLLALMLLPDIYIYRMYVRKWTRKTGLRLLFFLPSAALFVSMLGIRIWQAAEADHQHAVGVFLIVFMLICVPKAFFFVFDTLGRLLSMAFKRWRTGLRRTFRVTGMALGGTAVLMLLTGALWGRSHFVVNRQTLWFKDLPPAFDGYRIAQFTDLHIGTFRNGHEADVDSIAALINRERAHAVVFVGDLVNYQTKELEGFERTLRSIQAPDGVFSVLGNHDYSGYIHYATRQALEDEIERLKKVERDSLGWKLLLNDHAIVRHGSDSIVIVGVENDGLPPFPSLGDLPKALKGISNGTFCVLLSHDPTHWRRKVLPDTSIQLTLSGHTHAGQFKVFGWSPVRYKYKEWSGEYEADERMLNVSDGIGCVLFPFRFGAWPELNVITLRKKQ